MFLKKWEQLPGYMQNEEVKAYYQKLQNKKAHLLFKRCFDFIVGICVGLVLLPVMLVIAILIKLDSKGPVLFKQERVTKYGKHFHICKFRTMIVDAEEKGTQVTIKSDSRITKIGEFLRKFRIDEFPQVINVIMGDMSFVGTRPEVPKYVEKYSPEMLATLLLPAGITSNASIMYKDEEQLLSETKNVDDTYINEVLPEKMKYNLESIRDFSVFQDIKTMVFTVLAVVGMLPKTYVKKGNKKDVENEKESDVNYKS